MESTEQQIITTYAAFDPRCIQSVWGQLNTKLLRSEKNAQEIATLYHILEVLTQADEHFLSEAQYKDWRDILDNLFNNYFCTNSDVLFHEEKKYYTHQKFLDQLEDHTCPSAYATKRLDIISWAKKMARNQKHQLPTWPVDLHLQGDFKENLLADENGIKKIRLKSLKEQKNKTLIELYKAQQTPPEKLPEFGTAYISELMSADQAIKEPEARKSLAVYLTVLVNCDLDWFSTTDRQELESGFGEINTATWKKEEHSKKYYRYKLAALTWAEEKIKKDECEDLSWLKKVITKPETIELPSPSKSMLKEKRLHEINKQRKDTLELLKDFDKRQELREKVELKNLKNECVIS